MLFLFKMSLLTSAARFLARSCSSPVSGLWLHMPIYEFHCEKCGKESELLVRSAKWEGTPCPHCGSTRLEKKLSVFASSGPAGGPEPACTGTPRSCGMCGTGKPHSH